jgi:hypothetical protein
MVSFFLLLYESLGNKFNQKHNSNPKNNWVYAWGKRIFLKGEGKEGEYIILITLITCKQRGL